MAASMTANSETRFAHLLEPIRDIAQNWSIDIALELEDYLTELESITISFDDGKQVDFTEAALLIQGSACVYSKKVEHLYTLVLNTLNQVVEKKKNAEKNKDGEERPAGAEDEEDEEDEDAFGCLEDTLKEVENVSQPVVGTAAMKDVRPFTLASAPVSLMPQQGTSNGHDETSSKMNLSSLHASGALLLPNVHIPLHVLATLPAPPPPPSNRRKGPASDAAAAAAARLMAAPVEDTAVPMDDDDNDGGMPDFDDGDDGWQEALDAPAPPEYNPLVRTDEMGVGQMSEAVGAPATPQVARTPLRGPGQQQPVQAPTFDPWAPLDAHDPCGAARRPFRRGKTYSVPPAHDEGVNDEEDDVEAASPDKEGEEAGDKENSAIGGIVGGADLLRSLGLLSTPRTVIGGPGSPTSVVVPLRAPLWEQFGSLHNVASRQRAQARKQRRLEAAKLKHLPSADVDAAEVEADALVQPAGGGAAGGGAADAMLADGLLAPVEDAYADDDWGNVFDNDDDDIEPDPMADIEPLGTQGTQGAFGGGGRLGKSQTATYEDMCRAHVESCLEASASYNDDYELHRRVAEWDAKIKPLLDNEARRDEFDIVEYAERLLANFDGGDGPAPGKKSKVGAEGLAGGARGFAELANCTDSYEVARMFLATLQLTNQGNIELDHQVGEVETTLAINLLSRHKHPAREHEF